jgi:hypothetical protein
MRMTDNALGIDDDQTSLSLERAMQDAHIPVENLELIRRYTRFVGVDRIERKGRGISVFRADGGTPLTIAFGWATGFRSENEAREACGDEAHIWQWNSRNWGVSHPVNKIRSGSGDRTATTIPDLGTCDVCYMKRAASGSCDCD